MGSGETTAYAVTVEVVGGDQSTLLSLASVLHRRGVDVLAAELSRPVGGRRTFTATLAATTRQVDTVAATLRNLVPVMAVEVVPAGESARTPVRSRLLA